MQPSYPLLQAVRHSGRISAALLPAPAGGPRRGVCEAWPQRPAPLEAGGSARLEAQAAVPRTQADAEVGKERGSRLGAAGRASFRVDTLGKPFAHLTWKAAHSRWGRGLRGRLPAQRCLSGAVGQVGAVLSAPVAQPPPQMLWKPLCPTPVGWPLSPCTSSPQDSLHNDVERPPGEHTGAYCPYALAISQTSSPAAPHPTWPPSLALRTRSWRNPSFRTVKLAAFHLREEKEGGGKRPGIRKQASALDLCPVWRPA
ncbi:uncharacterized protein LOC123634359 isoform X2 [Lemur catta]|uniref:uncharacterized protein LOC123634359 isoform X2 n=1 Tax=Lemur catta TaxID=9447 RepID=UPI001E26DAA0|nr:uncharacterized protein LOC123634359 isoform X2 [Lemur catta]